MNDAVEEVTRRIEREHRCPVCLAGIESVVFPDRGDRTDSTVLPYCDTDWPEWDGASFRHQPDCAYLHDLESGDLAELSAFADAAFTALDLGAVTASPILGLPDHRWMARWEWELSNERVGSWVHKGVHYIAPFTDWRTVDVAAQHYPGGDVLGSRWNPADPIGSAVRYARYLQHSYIVGRRYSVGYCFLIMPDGRVVELRGFDYRCAANRDHNYHAVATQYMVDIGSQPTAAQIESGRLVNRAIALRSLGQGVPWYGIVGHHELRLIPPTGRGTPTSCCGAPLYERLHVTPFPDGGLLHWRNLDPDPPVPPIPPPPEAPVAQDLFTTASFRIADTRSGSSIPNYGTGPLSARQKQPGHWNGKGLCPAKMNHKLQVPSRWGIPANAVALFLSITAVRPEADGFVQVWKHGAASQPSGDNGNFRGNEVTDMFTIAQVGHDPRYPGQPIFNFALNQDSHVTIDVLGWTTEA